MHIVLQKNVLNNTRTSQYNQLVGCIQVQPPTYAYAYVPPAADVANITVLAADAKLEAVVNST